MESRGPTQCPFYPRLRRNELHMSIACGPVIFGISTRGYLYQSRTQGEINSLGVFLTACRGLRTIRCTNFVGVVKTWKELSVTQIQNCPAGWRAPQYGHAHAMARGANHKEDDLNDPSNFFHLSSSPLYLFPFTKHLH